MLACLQRGNGHLAVVFHADGHIHGINWGFRQHLIDRCVFLNGTVDGGNRLCICIADGLQLDANGVLQVEGGRYRRFAMITVPD